MGLFDAIDKAKENQKNRAKIADYHYKAEKCVNDGKKIYADAYGKLNVKIYDFERDVDKFVSFKKGVFDEMNRMLINAGIEKQSIDSGKMEITLKYPDGCAVHPSDFLGGSMASELKLIVDSIPAPSITDFFDDTTSALWEAKAQYNEAKSYKERMRSERERINTAIDSMWELRRFMDVEKDQINAMMSELKKAINTTENDNDKQVALIKITNMIADTLTTQFIGNNFTITSEYNALHSKIECINDGVKRIGTTGWSYLSELI